MKKLLIFAAIAVFGFTNVNAQTEKGSWMFGADIGASFTSSTIQFEYPGTDDVDEFTRSTFSIRPNVNYFIMNNLAVGLDLSFMSSTEKESGVDDYKSNAISAIGNVTYFFKSDSSIAPYLGAGAGLMSRSHGDEDRNKDSGLTIKGRAGIAYFLNDSVSINFGVDYATANLSNKEDSDLKEKSTTLGVGLGFAFFL